MVSRQLDENIDSLLDFLIFASLLIMDIFKIGQHIEEW